MVCSSATGKLFIYIYNNYIIYTHSDLFPVVDHGPRWLSTKTLLNFSGLKLIHSLARSRSSCCLQKHIELEGIKGCLGSKCHFWSIPSSPLLLTINHIQSLYWSLLSNISYYYITAICHGSGGALAGANSSAAAARPLCRISLEHRVPLGTEFQYISATCSLPFRSLQIPSAVLSADTCPAKVTLSPSWSRVTWEDVRLALTAACQQLARFEGTPALLTPPVNPSIEWYRFNVQKWWLDSTLSRRPCSHTPNAL